MFELVENNSSSPTNLEILSPSLLLQSLPVSRRLRFAYLDVSEEEASLGHMTCAPWLPDGTCTAPFRSSSRHPEGCSVEESHGHHLHIILPSGSLSLQEDDILCLGFLWTDTYGLYLAILMDYTYELPFWNPFIGCFNLHFYISACVTSSV